MKGRMKFGVMILLGTILIFSPMVAFAQEEGEVTADEMPSESPEGSAVPTSEEDEVVSDNPSNPTSSPLAEAYEHPVSPHKPPGWEKGEKTGWGDSEVPPGWEKGEKRGWTKEDR